MLLMLVATSRYIGPLSHTHGIIRKCAVFIKMLDATVDLPDKQVEPVLLKMLLFLENFIRYAVHFYHLDKIDCPDPVTFNPDVVNASDGETALFQAVPPAVLLFANSLRTRISRLQSTNLAQALMKDFSTVINESMFISPRFADYFERIMLGRR